VTMILAIDGPAAAGKSTAARGVAEQHGLRPEFGFVVAAVDHELVHRDAADERMQPRADPHSREIRRETRHAIRVAQSDEGERRGCRGAVAVAVGDPGVRRDPLDRDHFAAEAQHGGRAGSESVRRSVPRGVWAHGGVGLWPSADRDITGESRRPRDLGIARSADEQRRDAGVLRDRSEQCEPVPVGIGACVENL